MSVQPLGQGIAYQDGRLVGAEREGEGPSQIFTWIMNADGSNARVLLSSNYGGGRLPWRK